jgi:clan AA aspartic protease (TIGR02281 family)
MSRALPPRLLAILVAWWILPLGISSAGPFEEALGFFQAGHYRWALEKFALAVDQAPRDPQRWWYLAESYRLMGDTGAAIPIYRQIVQTASDPAYASAARQVLESLGQPEVLVNSVPFQRRGSAVLIPARINGESVGSFVLDTGATFTSISSSVAQQLGIQPRGTGTVRLLTASGLIEAPVVILDEVEIGGAVARIVPAVIHDLPGMPQTTIGLLGLSFLERFRVNLDISSGTLLLESGK